MRGKGPILAMAALLAAALAACAGGSGSSGFDISAALENRIIDQALTEGTCLQGEGLTICPSGETFGSPPGQQTPGPNVPLGDPAVETMLGGATEQDCSLVAASDECDLVVSFVPIDFPPDTVFRVAVRSSDPLGTWEIATPPLDMGPTGRVTALRIPDGAIALQIAVLAFAEPEAVTTDLAFETLSASGADFAFVDPPLAIVP